MIRLIALALATLAVIILLLSLWQGWMGPEWIDGLLGNIVTELLSLSAALFIAEVVIKRLRASSGINQISPYLLKTLSPVLNLDDEISGSLGYTPKEIDTILNEYLEGKMNPVHLPEKLKERILPALDKITEETLDAAKSSLIDALEKVRVFSNVLEPKHILTLERAVDLWTVLHDLKVHNERDKNVVAEAFMDAHDSVCDVFHLFELPNAIEEMKRA